MDKALNIIFAGTPEFAAEVLSYVLQTRHKVSLVLSQPDRPQGRGRKLQATPVKRVAQQAGITLLQPESLRDETIQSELAGLKPDLMIVAAYGALLPKVVLETPRLGCINIHTSLLPRWRGAAPIQRALQAGDQKSGITIMQMDEGLDTGDILNQATCTLDVSDNSETLYRKLLNLTAELLPQTLEQLSCGEVSPVAQNHQQATYAHKLSKAEANLDWQLPAQQLANQVRAFYHWPVAFSYLAGQRVRVWQAKAAEPSCDSKANLPGTIISHHEDCLEVLCGDGQSLYLELVQLPGGRALPVAELLRSKADYFALGKRFQGEA